MNVAIITGSAGLIGSESVEYFTKKFDLIVGIDNNMRQWFFGNDASTEWNKKRLKEKHTNYKHLDVDIRDKEAIYQIFSEYNEDIKLIIHTAAQPSHDWAASDPFTDFSVNATGTLVLLEATRKFCSKAVFIFTSTNKVYGDNPNNLDLEELETRWEVKKDCLYFEYGIDENMSLDQTKHSLFGVSKVAADLLVQEYGRYFGLKTGTFRGGCLTGPNHSGTKLHGFLSYLMKCCLIGEHYTIQGYLGKQVRDNIHAFDLVQMFWHFYENPRKGEVYNTGGSRHSNCSMLEGISQCEEITSKKLNYSYNDSNRIGDHIWWISDIRKFQSHYPEWKFTYNCKDILVEIYNSMSKRF